MAIEYRDPHPIRLEVEVHFAAAHHLPRYDGPCRRPHGHNYRMIVVAEGAVDPVSGFLLDFHDLQRVVNEKVMPAVDHRDLNDLLENPTAENIARWIWEALAPSLGTLAEIRLYETHDCCVIYRGPRVG